MPVQGYQVKRTEQHRDLLRVYKQPESADKTQGARFAREMFTNEPDKFAALLSKLNLEHRKRLDDLRSERSSKSRVPESSEPTGGVSPPVVEPADEGTERVLGEVERLLGEKPWNQS